MTRFLVERHDPHWGDPDYWQWAGSFDNEADANAAADELRRVLVFPNGKIIQTRTRQEVRPFVPSTALDLLRAYGDQLSREDTAMAVSCAREEDAAKARQARRAAPVSAPKKKRKRDRDRDAARVAKFEDYRRRLREAAGRKDPYA